MKFTFQEILVSCHIYCLPPYDSPFLPCFDVSQLGFVLHNFGSYLHSPPNLFQLKGFKISTNLICCNKSPFLTSFFKPRCSHNNIMSRGYAPCMDKYLWHILVMFRMSGRFLTGLSSCKMRSSCLNNLLTLRAVNQPPIIWSANG